MSGHELNLLEAVCWLPGPVRRAMRRALASGWYHIEPGFYESETGVCPFVAAAKMAGVWRDGHAADGGTDWGSQTEPGAPCFVFAVSFDLYAEEAGTDRALEVVLQGLNAESRSLAA